MDKLYATQRHAADNAIWPLGKRDTPPPLWDHLVQQWTANAHPRNITQLIDELCSLGSGEDSTAYDIHRALEEGADWQGACEELGWQSTADIIERLDGAMEPSERRRLLRDLMLSTPGGRYYWVMTTPKWKDDVVESSEEVVAWQVLRDDNRETRELHDDRVDFEMQTRPIYSLIASIDPYGEALAMSCSLVKLLDLCPAALTEWLREEWLAPMGYVNVASLEWMPPSSWMALGVSLGVQLDPAEVNEWFLIDEHAATQLKALGGVVVDLPGVGMLYGRKIFGQQLYMDKAIEFAMIRIGYLENAPPLGALNHPGSTVIDDSGITQTVPDVSVCLGGFVYPFRTDAGVMPLRELEGLLVDQEYREQGWQVEWGDSITGKYGGQEMTFRLVQGPTLSVTD